MQIIALGGLVLVLIALHFIAKKLTKPITQLVKATEAVSAGKLEGISAPLPSPKSKDEIAKLCRSFAKMIVDLQEKEKIRGILNKVVSKEIAEEILKGYVHLGGEERRVTVLFADIRRFTEITTQLSPQEAIKLLNICMTKISQVIDDYGGVIDKYEGDAVMALFGVPIDRGDSALRAIKSALKIVEVLKAWNIERTRQNLVQIEMGIGIHSGEMVVGNIGAENRLNYTVIGKNVNMCSRLCDHAEGMQILISKQTTKEPHVEQNVSMQQLPAAELKGFPGKVEIFQVTGLLS